MFNYFLYFTGILIGIFIILIIISDKGDLRTLFKSRKEYFNNDNVDKYEKTDIVMVSDKKIDNNKIDNDMVDKFEKTDIVMVSVLNEDSSSIIDEPDDANIVLTNSNVIDKFNFIKLLKKKEMKVLISSYNKDNINNLDWYTDNKKYNNNIMLKLSNDDIIKELNNLNPLVNGYNIHNVSIEGPSNIIMYNNDKIINKFSILFMFIHKKFHNKINNLFIIYGIDNKNIVINIKEKDYNNNYLNYFKINNSMNDNNNLNDEYDTNNINSSINLLNNYHYYENHDILSRDIKEQKSYKLSYLEKLYTIELIIDDSIYNIHDINLETLKNDVIFFGLTMNMDDVVFHLNNTKYEFKRNTANGIKISNIPFIINKNKSCEIVLYSFAYLNEAISDKDLKTFKLYNKYKLHGIDTTKYV
jgi:hypothetical protein